MAGTYARETETLVIGGGPGGYMAAIRLGQLGHKALLVERSELGGECLNRGCIPSKALLHAGGLFHTLREEGSSLGIRYGELSFDLPATQHSKRALVEKERQGVRSLLKSAGATVLPGEARFTGPQTAQLVAPDGGSERIDFRYAVVATGAVPVELPGFTVDGDRVLNAAQMLELEYLPKSLLVLGGGVSGCELGEFYAQVGVSVTIVELLPQILPGLEPELSAELTKAFLKLGVGVRTGTRARALERSAEGVELTVEGPGGPEKLQAERLFLTVGKRADTARLGCEEAGLVPEPRTGFLAIDAQQRTKVPHIFAVGDVCRGPMLAHKAYREGIVAAEAIAGLPSRFDFQVIPGVVFTTPELATVGLGLAEAQQKGHQCREAKFPLLALGRAHAAHATTGWTKIVAEEESGLLLGVHAAGESAGEFVTEAALAIEMGATVRDLAGTIHPHPTFSESLQEAALLWLGEPMHVAKRR
ncbi:MAG: dihydrolipoyl dehydrogenase [Thermoplasmata archaeon]|nr:dihydrolipoyl dehydrogenase [Thermoplasmata archaeon]